MKQLKRKILTLSSTACLLAGFGLAANADLKEEQLKYYSAAISQEKAINYELAKKNYLKALALSDRDTATLIKLSAFLISDHTVFGDERKQKLNEAIGYLNKANAISPGDAVIKLLLAKANQALGNYDEAINNYERAVTLEPDNVLLKMNLGLLYYESRDFGKSIELLNKVILAYPDNLKARSYLGAALQATENYLAAIEQYNYVLNYERDNFSIVKNIGDCWLALEQLDRAKENFLLAQAIDPNVPDLYADIAFIDQKLKNFDSSIGNYRKAIALKDSKLWRKSLAYTLWANKDLDEAVEEFKGIEEHNLAGYIYQLLENKDGAVAQYAKAVEKNPKDLKSRFNLGRLRHEGKDYVGAKEQYLKIIEERPNDAETLYLLGVAEQETGAISEAINYYKEIQSKHLDKKNTGAGPINEVLKKNIYFNLGLAHRIQNDLSESEINFEKALEEKFTPVSDVYRELVTVKILQEKRQEAKDVVLRWLSKDPTNVSARNLYADLLVSLEKEREAIEQLKLASVLDQTSETRIKLANLLHSQNNLYEALAEYQLVLNQEDDNLNAILGAANNYRSLGLKDEAVNLYKKALEAYPDDLLANYNYGLILQETNKLPQALKQYIKVEQINPDFADNYYALGLCYWDLGEKDKAVSAWDSFLKLSNNAELRKEVVQLMKEHQFSNIQTNNQDKVKEQEGIEENSIIKKKEDIINQLKNERARYQRLSFADAV